MPLPPPHPSYNTSAPTIFLNGADGLTPAQCLHTLSRPAKKRSSERDGGLTAPLTAGAVGSLAQSSCPWTFASTAFMHGSSFQHVCLACPLTASRSQPSVIPGLTVLHSTEHKLTHLLVYCLSLSLGTKLHKVLQLCPHCREQFWAHCMCSTNMC